MKIKKIVFTEIGEVPSQSMLSKGDFVDDPNGSGSIYCVGTNHISMVDCSRYSRKIIKEEWSPEEGEDIFTPEFSSLTGRFIVESYKYARNMNKYLFPTQSLAQSKADEINKSIRKILEAE